MKKFLTPVIFVLLYMPIQVMAQYHKGDVEMGIGGGSLSSTAVTLAINAALGGEKEPLEYSSGSGTLFLSGKYFLKERLALGITLGTEKLSGYSNMDWTIASSNTPFTYTIHKQTIATELTMIYSNNRNVRLYGLIGLGFSQFIVNYQFSGLPDINDKWLIPAGNIAAQVTPIGIRVGNTFGLFLEFGYGYRGMVNMGLSYQFKRKRKLVNGEL